MARILAIDLGEVRMGLAVSDDLMITAQPLPTWRRMGRRSDFAHLGDLV
ncbi:MAG: Holliday junction resolvase RuvX, partial [Candidatus Methylomirabilales bacterium]